LIKKQNIILEYTLDQLINANIYLGYHKKFLNESMFKYLSGIRSNILLINLSYTIILLKQTCNFIQHTFYNFGFIWLIDCVWNKHISMSWQELYNLDKLDCRFYIWNHFWYAGIITNFSQVFKSSKINWKDINFPNVLFFFNTTKFITAINEPIKTKIPFISIVDSNSSSDLAIYTIPGNEKSISSIFFYYKIFFKFLLRLNILEKFYFFLQINK
jgi:ribosomal protein S2